MAYGQMTKAVPPHERHAVFQFLTRVDGERVFGHDLCEASAAGIAAFRDDALHQIALGKNPHQFAVVYHGNRADVAFNHRAHGFQHGLAHVRLVGFLVFDQIADPHFDSPRIEFRR